MKKQIEKLKKYGNLLNSILDKETPIKIIRVWKYESKVGDICYQNQKKYMEESKEEQEILEVIKTIKEKLYQLNWMDNKIAIELSVGFWKIFIGLWDDCITIGEAVIPSEYIPHFKKGMYGSIAPIKIR